MYELIILILLVRFPANGYKIAHIINDIIGPYARMSNGRLYPLLARMEENGLIELHEDVNTEQRGERNARPYQITAAGRKRFHALMMDTTSNPGEYQRTFRQKVPVFYLLQPSERLYLLDHYSNYCQAHILHLIAERDDLAKGNYTSYEHASVSLNATLDVMKHMGEQWQAELEWVRRLREQEIARWEGDRSEGATTVSE